MRPLLLGLGLMLLAACGRGIPSGRVAAAKFAALDTRSGGHVSFVMSTAALSPPWTLEAWIAPETMAVDAMYVGLEHGGSTLIGKIGVKTTGVWTSGVPSVSCAGHALSLDGPSYSPGVPTHVAVVALSSSSMSLFVGGVGVLSNPTIANCPISRISVGASRPSVELGRALVQSVRLSNIARYTSNFTPPGYSLAQDASTLFLTRWDLGLLAPSFAAASLNFSNVELYAGPSLTVWPF